MAKDSNQLASAPRFWVGDVGEKDDFGVDIVEDFIDGKMIEGPWAIMTPQSWKQHGIGIFGTGCGQMYHKTPDGKWMKVKG